MDDIRLTIELYREGDTFGAWLSDDLGGSGIEVQGSTPEEVGEGLAPYISDYFYE